MRTQLCSITIQHLMPTFQPSRPPTARCTADKLKNKVTDIDGTNTAKILRRSWLSQRNMWLLSSSHHFLWGKRSGIRFCQVNPLRLQSCWRFLSTAEEFQPHEAYASPRQQHLQDSLQRWALLHDLQWPIWNQARPSRPSPDNFTQSVFSALMVFFCFVGYF